MKRLLIFTVLFSGLACYGQGSGKALSFDGNDYVHVGTNNMGITNSLSVSTWAKSNNKTYKWICGKYDYTTRGFHLFMDGGRYGLAGRDGSGAYRDVKTTKNFDDGDWHHVTGVCNGSVWSIYVDGILQGQINTGYASTNLANGANFEIGRYWWSNSQYWDNHMDELSIWNRALSQDEIRHRMCQKLTGTEPGLVAYYRMDEGTDNTCPGGQDVCDASGNGHHGVKN